MHVPENRDIFVSMIAAVRQKLELLQEGRFAKAACACYPDVISPSFQDLIEEMLATEKVLASNPITGDEGIFHTDTLLRKIL